MRLLSPVVFQLVRICIVLYIMYRSESQFKKNRIEWESVCNWQLYKSSGSRTPFKGG
jgi:hypothetical protein